MIARTLAKLRDADAELYADAAQGSLLSLVARLRPDLDVDQAQLEVDLTIDDFDARLSTRQSAQDGPGRLRRHLRALVAAATVSGGLAAARLADIAQATTQGVA